MEGRQLYGNPTNVIAEEAGKPMLHQTATRRDGAEEALRQSEERLAAELEAMTRLHALSTRLFTATDLRTALEDVLEEAVLTCRADFGNIQLLNPQDAALEIVAQRGFRQDFLDYFRTVRVDDGSACARALHSGERILIADVALDPSFEPHRGIAAAAGFRAVQSTPLTSRGGSVLGMLSTHFCQPHRPSERDQRFLDLYARHAADLVERLRADAQLRAVREKLQLVTDAMSAPVTRCSRDLRYLWVSKPYADWLGRTPEQIIGRPIRDVIGPAAFESLRPRFEQVLAGRKVSYEEEVDFQGVGRRWINAIYTPTADPTGVPDGWVAVVLDITERKRAEEEARKNQEIFKLVHGIGKIGHWEWNSLTDENKWSPEIEALYGLKPGTFEGTYQAWAKLLHPDDLPRAEAVVRRALETGRYFTEFRVIWPDGSVHWLEARASVFKDGHENPVRIMGVNMDVTERKELEEASRQADRRKDEFLATLAHELRNPLAPLRNAVELLRRAGGRADLNEKALGVMERQLGVMVRLIDDLLDVSRITRGKLQLRKERVELAAVVRSAVEAARPCVGAQAHELTIMLPDPPVYLQADPIRLAQVYSNLLTNAAKYTEKGGHIWLTAERQSGEVVVSVRDTGIGIAAEHLPRLFEMFSQVDSALERSQGGLGIGLSLVRGLVELHGGSVEARSGGPGRGSEFIVRLPALEAPVEGLPEPNDTGEKAPSSRPRRILVVDDNRDAADSLALMLRLLGHDVQTAHDGLEAVQAAACVRPDVVVLDVGMPRMNGYEAARHIRAQPWGGGMALIALTGWGQEEDKRQAAAAGFDRHLTKPVGLAALERLLAELQEA
jgi:PAS domain S-box-containing protein